MAGVKTTERLMDYIRAARAAGVEVTCARISGRVIELDFSTNVTPDEADPYDTKDMRA
ncbi:hypothetical protein SAMN06273572_10220 [Monaibacterium marinum]|uniref:Uncharacterized protein n=1 Tax=Pontivivens marinum TaxID=1690039 RepID=A0A2C9CPS8_9RHOB|nr:hypothetical protein SAMN06273572_10220 [Monaibacterium marinum]